MFNCLIQRALNEWKLNIFVSLPKSKHIKQIIFIQATLFLEIIIFERLLIHFTTVKIVFEQVFSIDLVMPVYQTCSHSAQMQKNYKNEMNIFTVKMGTTRDIKRGTKKGAIGR